MTDARLELAPDKIVAPPWARRLATLGAFAANGAGIGCWAAAIPRVKADLELSDATLSAALLAFAAGAIIAMPLMGLFAHRLRSGPASVVTGFGLAAAIVALGFAQSLETLCVGTFLVGATHGAMDIAMNANASDIERRWGKPIMSSFHAGVVLHSGVAHDEDIQLQHFNESGRARDQSNLIASRHVTREAPRRRSASSEPAFRPDSRGKMRGWTPQNSVPLDRPSGIRRP